MGAQAPPKAVEKQLICQRPAQTSPSLYVVFLQELEMSNFEAGARLDHSHRWGGVRRL